MCDGIRTSSDGFLDVRDGVSVREHLVESAVSIFSGKSSEAIAEIGKCVKPGAFDAIDDAHDEEGIFADGIVVFKMDHDILGGSVIGYRLEAFSDERGMRLCICTF